ncbi:MAG: hypothetical protein OEM26_10285, partial [Saprospiraceae bacterium]|nr:hypothetical protein [Saprospiraceae bacterium]
MRLLLLFLGFFFYLTLSGQSCLLPQSMDELRPDRCAIRHISENELRVKVILEFEKEGRVLASQVPNKQTNGIRTTLRGIFELQFDHKGALVAEQKRYLQTGTLPADCHVFGLGDQQYQKLEARLTFISEEDYKNLPWLDVQGEKKSPKSLDNRIRFETTVETDPQTGQLSAIHLLKHQELENEEVEVIEKKATNLMEYDSATKKIYWMPLIEAFSNAVSGTSHLLMGRKDKKLDKFAPSRLLRFATFDSLGTEINHHDLIFDYPMELVHVFENNSDISIGLQHVILMFRHLDVEAEINPKVDKQALYFFVFDSSGKLLSNGVAKHDEPMAVFHPIHYDWLENGITWWHQHEDKISVSHLTYSGQYIVRDALAGLPNLEALIEQRSNRHKPITLQLQHNPLQTSAGHWFYIFKVQEDISIGHQNDNYRGRATPFLTHGVLLYSLNTHG